MRYLYAGHMGGLYTTDEPMGHSYLYCEQCGDSDYFLGTFETLADFWSIIKDECSIDGSGGLSLQYIYPIIVTELDLPDDVRYADKYERDCGFCCNTDAEIISRIEELIKESNKDENLG